MNQSLKSKCDLFIKNRDAMKDAVKFDNNLIYPLCAYIYTEKGLALDGEKIKTAKEIIKSNVSVFSNFRGLSKNILATMLSLEASPDVRFADIQTVYSRLKEEFISSSYLPLAAFMIARMAQPNSYDSVVARTKSIYKLMKSEHPFLTSSEDCTFAALFALSDRPEAEIVNEAESCYSILKGRFMSLNAVQSLSHALALGEENAESKCMRTIGIFDRLKEKGIKYGTTYELATLGVLSLTGKDTEAIVNDISDVSLYLKANKGFGTFGIGDKQRHMYAAMLTALEYSNQASETLNTAALNSVTAMMIAQQAAMTAAIAAGTAASAAGSAT